MKIQDLKTYLEANFNYTFYPNGFPEESKSDCGFVKLTGGSLDKYVKGIATVSFQVMVRSKHPANGEIKSQEIFDHFHGKEYFNIGSTFVSFSLPDQSIPIVLGTDDNDRTLYSVNITCKLKN